VAPRQHGEESIRPPIHAVSGKGDIGVGVRGEIFFVEGHRVINGKWLMVFHDPLTMSNHLFLAI
jgi:hypothetical protein